MPDNAVASPAEERQALSRVPGHWWLVFLCAVLAALRGATLLYDHNLNSIDGAMQTWFALGNFADGAKLGESFQSYLGITMILSLLPWFMAFGETLWASTLAAYIMVLIGSFAGAYAIVWMLRPIPAQARWAFAILLVFAFYYLGALAGGLLPYPYAATFDPGVSLRPLRGALPFFVLPVFVWAVRQMCARRGLLAGVGLGLVCGLGLLWSNDAGIPLAIAAAIGIAAALWRKWAQLGTALLVYGFGVAMGSAAVLILVTHGDPSGWFQYNYVDVAGDQYWYFGPWGEEARVLSVLDLPWIFIGADPVTAFSLTLLTGSVFYAFWKRLRGRGSPVRGSAFVFVGASIIGTALLPQIGGHIGYEYKAITFVLGLCAPLVVFQAKIFATLKPLVARIGVWAAPAAAALASLIMVGMDTANLISTSSETDRTVYAEKLGFYVTPQTAEDLKAIERFSQFLDERGVADDGRVLSVYTSTLDIAAGAKSPSNVGSLIHALGAGNRADFNKLLFGDVVAVTTIAPDYTGWEGWNTRANWPFFKTLRDIYDPIGRTDQHVLWVRRGGTAPKQPATCEVIQHTIDRFEVVVTSQAAGLASLFIEREAFDGEPRTAVLTVTEDSPFIRSTEALKWGDFPRYGIANTRVVEVPAPVTPGEETRLSFQVIDGSNAGFADCNAVIYPQLDFGALPSLSDGVDRQLSEWAQ